MNKANTQRIVMSGMMRRRTRSDWAGVGIGDAFKRNLDFYPRMAAQRVFYDRVRHIQQAAAQLAGGTQDPFVPEIRPQISPCYTSYPASLAAQAAIGLTGFLEFQYRAPEHILFVHLRDYLDNPARIDRVQADPESYKKLAQSVAHSIQTRLLLEDLSRSPAMGLVELYRLFLASQQTMRFSSVPEIVNAVILYGDVLPDWEPMELHPLTRSLLRDIADASRPFFERLGRDQGQELIQLGLEWVKTVCYCLALYLPEAKPPGSMNPEPPVERESPGFLRKLLDRAERFRFADEQPEPASGDRIPPLDGPNPPALFDPPRPWEQIASSLLKSMSSRNELPPPYGSGLAEDQMRVLNDLAAAVDRAGGQQADWEDMRADLVEQSVRTTPFREGPIQGSPTDGHAVSVQFGEGPPEKGEIFDCPVELSDDVEAYDRLMAESRPITSVLRRTLYPNLEQVPQTERLRPSGSIDPARLAMAGFSEAIFKRQRMQSKADRRGRPVVLIACDGSGSLNAQQMNLTKALAAAWLQSTARTNVQVLAGLYHSGTIRPGLSGPLVQWMYHPRKTQAISKVDATRALVALPRTGTGVQSDALSLAFMIEEAEKVAGGRMIYLILISDCKWNQSFNTGKTGEQEVRAFFETANREFDGKLHTTLVALGGASETSLDDLLDKVIVVSDGDLGDYAAVAAQIGVYVASCMIERQRQLSKG
ncbi:MAG TPA: hypothetical protein VFV34_12390 [Blastocatellia bacterium]|nr:hypothetical protein [Blastocatellia bacterium]